MNTQTIKQLIEGFLHNDISESLQRRFRRWILQNDGSALKEEALRQEWDAVMDSPVLEERSKQLQRLHQTIRMNDAAKRRERFSRSLRIAAAAAAVLLLMVGEYYLISRAKPTTPEVHLLTAENSKGEFRLPDGSKVWLNASSRLSYPQTFDRKIRHVVLEGEAYFEVAHDQAHPFVVEMNQMQIEVLGTTFDARYDRSKGLYEATLNSGVIRISAPQLQNPIQLSPNERLVFDQLSGSMTIEQVNPNNYKSWIYSKLTFFDMPLGEIITNLERWYNTPILTDSEMDRNTRLSFHIKHESLEETLQVISLIIPIRYTLDQGVVTLHKKHNTK